MFNGLRRLFPPYAKAVPALIPLDYDRIKVLAGELSVNQNILETRYNLKKHCVELYGVNGDEVLAQFTFRSDRGSARTVIVTTRLPEEKKVLVRRVFPHVNVEFETFH